MLNKKINSKKGVTLMELLVVVALIGVMASIFVIIIDPNTYMKRSRDTQRKGDLRTIQSALEIYRSDNGSYPDSLSTLTSGTVYLRNIPSDPKGTAIGYNSGNYYYSSGGVSYTLAACLENNSDEDRGTEDLSPGGGTCSSGKYYVVHDQ